MILQDPIAITPKQILWRAPEQTHQISAVNVQGIVSEETSRSQPGPMHLRL